MIVENINKIVPRPRVLIAPLDWGLGHATRCIPVINVLIGHNIEVLLAADGFVAKLLQKEFPGIVILPLQGYKIRYSRGKRTFNFKLLTQIPRILKTIYLEHKWLKKIIPQYGIDAVISDNRFGLFYSHKPCVYVTHQLSIQTGNQLLNKIIQKINYYFINKFNECWLPDEKGINNIAGILSHPKTLPKTQVKYLGILTRFKKINEKKKYDLLILISGPEPLRSVFENIILKQLHEVEGEIVLVRGLPENKNNLQVKYSNLVIHEHLPAEELNKLIHQSNFIITRSGYSTIMDLLALNINAILVPTPGQTEQEYLADHLMKQKRFISCKQEDLNLKNEINKLKDFNFIPTVELPQTRNDIITKWADGLRNEF